MKRSILWGAVVCLLGCPSTTANTPGEAGVDRVAVQDTGGGEDRVTAGDDVLDGGTRDATLGNDGGDGGVGDGGRDGGSGDAGDAGAPDITMTFEFSSVALNGSAGGISMRANMTWHGNLRGSAGGITFEGEIR